jgi:general nucleoside transport system permease protein
VAASMLIGAFVGFAVSLSSQSIVLGVLAAAVAGMLIALVMAFFSVTLLTNQIITGTVLDIFAIGATSFGFDLVSGVAAASPQIPVLPNVPIPVLDQLPVLGPVLFDQNLFAYAAILFAILAGVTLYHTHWGLDIRACGEDHRAAASTGIDVMKVRYQTLLAGGLLAGLAGASLTIGQLGLFTQDITAGRGFIAIAAVVFGRWNPYLTMAAAIFFGFADALQLFLQTFGIGIPYQFLLMLPYLLTILALVLSVGHRLDVGTPAGPRDLTVPYEQEGG